MKKLLLIFLIVLVPIAVLAVDNDRETIKVGALFPLSSWAAVVGRSELDAIRIAVDEINAAGGIEGKNLELVVEDNHSEFTHTVSAFKKLANVDRVQFVLGPSWAEFAEVAAPVAQSTKVVMLTPSGCSKGLVDNRDYVFTLFPKFEAQIVPLVKYIKAQKHKKIAILSTINAYCDGIASTIKQSLGKVVKHYENVNPEETDFRSIIAKFKKEGVDAVIAILLESGENAAFLRQSAALKLNAKVYGAATLPYDSLILKDKSMANGVVFFDYEMVADKSFVEKYEEASDVDMIYSAAKAYDSVYVMAEAIRHCGLEADKLKACLLKTNHQGASGTIRFDAQGGLVPNEYITGLYEVVDGQYVKIG